MIIATTQLYRKLPTIKEEVDHILNPIKYNQNIQILKENRTKTITIYDHTMTSQLKNQESTDVSDHVNQTGHNPLIGKQKTIPKMFLDISKTYQHKNGKTTHCLGEKFQKHHGEYLYPSHYLCHLSIICVSLGFRTIKARLINIL